jgi:hypothetical protein
MANTMSAKYPIWKRVIIALFIIPEYILNNDKYFDPDKHEKNFHENWNIVHYGYEEKPSSLSESSTAKSDKP